MDNQAAFSLIDKNILIFQNYLLNLHTILNTTAIGRADFQHECQNVIKMANFIEECGFNILRVCQSHQNYTPWKKVPFRKRTRNQDPGISKKARLS